MDSIYSEISIFPFGGFSFIINFPNINDYYIKYSESPHS